MGYYSKTVTKDGKSTLIDYERNIPSITKLGHWMSWGERVCLPSFPPLIRIAIIEFLK